MAVILLETLIVTLLYEAFVVALILKKGPLYMINDYPPKIAQRVKELGLIGEDSMPGKKEGLLHDLIGLAVMVILFFIPIWFINGERTFFPAFWQSYLFLNGISWFDALVLDCIWFCHSKRFVIPGTEDMVKEYHDYWFHLRFAVIGLAGCAVPAAAIGGIVYLLALI